MSTIPDIKENLATQVLELETLQSVYPEELSISNHGTLADINEFIAAENQDEIPQRLEYDILISTIKGAVDLIISLPLDYPNVDPEVYCRSSSLDRKEQVNLNKALLTFTQSQEKGEPIIYSLISWVQDNAETYFVKSDGNEKKDDMGCRDDNQKKKQDFGRYWIYSHHIYSKVKRRNIMDLAKDYALTGFSFIGKPGIICIEGAIDDCEYFWQEVKSWNWQRILVKFTEKNFDLTDDLTMYRKFSDFQELCFVFERRNSDRHNDKGELLKYLTEHSSEHAFKELFGLEAKSIQQSE